MKPDVFVITVVMLAGAIFSTAETNAQNRTGDYRRPPTGWVNIQDRGRGKNRSLLLSIVVGQPEPGICSGSVEGRAGFTGKNVAELVLTDCEDKTGGGAEICRLKFVFSGSGRLVVREDANCHRCHGFNCIFDGTYFKQRPGKQNRRAQRAKRK